MNTIGIFVEMHAQGVRLLQFDDRNSPRHEEGLRLPASANPDAVLTAGRQFIAALVDAQQQAERRRRGSITVRVSSPSGLEHLEAEGGPALFGPSLDELDTTFYGSLVRVEPETGCIPVAADAYRGKIAVVRRGGCMFVEKVARSASRATHARLVTPSAQAPLPSSSSIMLHRYVHFLAHIPHYFDKLPFVALFFSLQTTDNPGMFTMSGDGTDDVAIPSLFVHQRDGDALLQALLPQPHAIAVHGASAAAVHLHFYLRFSFGDLSYFSLECRVF